MAFVTTQADLNSFVPFKQAYNRVADVYVDAIDGHLLYVQWYGGIFGGSEKRIAPFSGELEPEPITLRSGKQSQTVRLGSLAPAKEPFKSGKPVMVKRGKLTLFGEFNAESGLLRISQGKGKYVVTRPNSQLTKALRTLIPY